MFSSGKYNLALVTEWVQHPCIILSFGLIPKLLHLEEQQEILLLLLDANNSTKGLSRHRLPCKRLWKTGIILGTLTSSGWQHFSIRQHRLKMDFYSPQNKALKFCFLSLFKRQWAICYLFTIYTIIIKRWKLETLPERFSALISWCLQCSWWFNT